MALIVISVDREKLPKHTDEEYRDWVRFSLHERRMIGMENPLFGIQFKAEVKEWGG